MRTVAGFDDYELIDADSGERLERWKNIVLIRPDPQIIWSGERKDSRWKTANAVYHRSQSGGGRWEVLKPVPDVWSVNYEGLTFRLKPMGFKHTGLFPEQAVNWTLARQLIERENRQLSVLNLFAYTGAATLACLNAGAKVTHVDASKGMVQWAKENAGVSGLSDAPVRWLVDDCLKFVKREIRRGNKYDAVIMDPPSYGRGPDGEVWKLEQQLAELLGETGKLLSDNAVFFFLNSYTGGLSPTILNYMVKRYVVKNRGGEIFTDEIGLHVSDKGISLPAGNTTIWTR
ncbi:MAG: class I SAM-dependent methyltransferase [Acutalibacteraceae bacterium]